MIRIALSALFAPLLTPVLLFGQVGESPAAQSPIDPAAQGPAASPAADPTADGADSKPQSTLDGSQKADAPPEGEALTPAQLRQKALRESIQPPDGKWLVDAEGRSYFIKYQSKSMPYRNLGNGRVRIVYGGEYDLAGEDEENLWFKVYRIGETPERPPSVAVPTAEELAASAATFVAPTGSADRLRLRSYDTGLPTRGLWRNGFDLADMDGDNKLDFVHGPPRRSGDQPRVFRGDGKGAWTSYPVSVPAGILDYGDIKVADFNSDGKADLATASHFRGIAVFVGDGKGKFTSWGEGLDYDAPRPGYDASGFSARRIEVLDWNKDGKPDLVALSEGPRIALLKTGNSSKVAAGDANQAFGPRLYLNNGNGTWTPVVESGSRLEIFGDDLAVADFDGDKRLDFLTSTNAMGRMDLLYVHGQEAGGPWRQMELPLRPKAYVNAVAAGDFDRDHRTDIAVTYTSFELGIPRVGIDVYFSRGEGRWERQPAFSRDGRDPITALDAGDLDGDKALDLVATDQDGRFVLLLGDGKGGFVREESPEAQQPRGPCRGYGLRMTDLDRDGRAEIVASFAGEANVLYDPGRCPTGGGVAAWTLESGQ